MQNLWMMAGTSKKRRYIPIRPVYEQLVPGSAESLLAFHALTGSDVTSYIANHTKKSSWKVFQANHHLLTSMGVGSTLTDDTERAAETFICRIYNILTTDSVDTARHTLFYNVKKETLFTFTFTRVHHQALIVIWRNAHLGQPEIPAPETMGWKQSEAGLQPILMSLPNSGRMP